MAMAVSARGSRLSDVELANGSAVGDPARTGGAEGDSDRLHPAAPTTFDCDPTYGIDLSSDFGGGATVGGS